MARQQPGHTLTEFARAGFTDLSGSRERLTDLAERLDLPARILLSSFSAAADPDAALARSSELAATHLDVLVKLDRAAGERLALLFGASPALGTFFQRHATRLAEILDTGGRLFTQEEATTIFTEAVTTDDRSLTGEQGWNALRTRYRELLAEVVLFDLVRGAAGEAMAAFDEVARALSALAGAAIEVAQRLAQASLIAGDGTVKVPADQVHAVRLAVIAMGKCGAEELNVVSDVDVMFIVESRDEDLLSGDDLVRVGTKLARETMRALHDPAFEPPLWQVDANLRPEGRTGPLVRTLASMMAYYDRWAQAWEFQALLKARALAGDLELGHEFTSRIAPLVWASASREDFVGSVQRMRERVTEHISEDETDVQLKLGPGGLRDIEFSVQLLQLVHGQYDERLHLAGTLPALEALVDGGYVARSDASVLAADYRFLRVLEHRLQVRDLRRTALMPTDEDALRVLARASRLAATAAELTARWEEVKREVRSRHLKIFYAPLLSAVASLPDDELVLGTDEARTRLLRIGFRDPDGAMRHMEALTSGTSRRARIQRNLMPVLLRLLAEGTDPDYGLLAFRRVSEANKESHWYLRLLRDGTDAAERLMTVLANSKFAAELLVTIPDAVAWLESRSLLMPVDRALLVEEMRALASRRATPEQAAAALRAVHRREVLRLALGRLTEVIDDAEVSEGLDTAHTALLEALMLAIGRETPELANGRISIALIGMGRFGGREMGFASDIDLLAVSRADDSLSQDAASRAASKAVATLRSLVSDPRFSVDLDFDLRPEGKNGPLVRSLAGYRNYYEKWSLTWEAQALLRARPIAGDVALGRDFMELADRIRYPANFSDADAREVRRLKARVEAERLPQGADPSRHLKLGPGGLSDVEWLVQLLQLTHGHEHAHLRTTSTIAALSAADELGLFSGPDARRILEVAWHTASAIRSAIKLWSGRSLDVLPSGREDLEGVAVILEIGSGNTAALEERWLTVSRRARAVFDREFYNHVDTYEQFPIH